MDDKRYNNDGNIETPMQDDYTGPIPTYPAVPLKSRRSFWARLALVLMVLGVGLYVAGFLSGARGGEIYFENRRLRFATDGDAEFISMATEPFHSIDVRASSSRVIILPGDTYTVVVPTGQRAPTVDVTNGVLSIDSRLPGRARIHFFSINHSGMRDEIRIYFPDNSNANGGIQVTTSSGRIQIDGVSAGYINANSSSGRIEISNMTTPMSNVNLRSSSGRIAIDNVDITNDLTAQASSGRIEIRNIASPMNRAYIRSTSGRVSVENLEMAREVTIQTSSGRIDLDRVGWGDLSARASSGRINIVRGRGIGGSTGGNITLQTSSGAVNLEIVGNRSDYRYVFNTSSGSMRVNGERFPGRNFSGGNGTNEISIRTSSGSIRLDFVR